MNKTKAIEMQVSLPGKARINYYGSIDNAPKYLLDTMWFLNEVQE